MVKDLDRFEMVMQAYEYECTRDVPLNEFFESVRGKIRHPKVTEWFDALQKKRDILSGGSVYRFNRPDVDKSKTT